MKQNELGLDFYKYATKHMGISSLNMDAYEKNMSGIYTSMTPYVIEERQLNVTQMDVFSRMMMDRIIWLNAQVDDQSMGIANAQMLFLASVDAKKDIQVYLNSPGGSVISGTSFVDVMNWVAPDIATVVMGMAASMGAVISSSGAKGKRSILKHSRFMIHDISGGQQGNFKDMKTSFELSEQLRKELFVILAENSGHTPQEIEDWCDRDKWFTSTQAVEAGFMDKVITKPTV